MIFLLVGLFDFFHDHLRNYGYGFGLVEGFVDANQFVSQLEHVISQRYDYKLSILCTFLDVVCHDRHIFIVKCSVDFVHEVQWCRFVVMKGKYEWQTAQGLLASWQFVNLLPCLFRRSDTKIDALTERIETVYKLQFGISTLSQQLIHFLQFWRYHKEALSEHRKPFFLQSINFLLTLHHFVLHIFKSPQTIHVLPELHLEFINDGKTTSFCLTQSHFGERQLRLKNSICMLQLRYFLGCVVLCGFSLENHLWRHNFRFEFFVRDIIV